ncbi:MAG: ATP-binding cassette domain-containing protein [Opitutales bacterium]
MVSSEHSIQAVDLTKRFGKLTAVRDVSFSVQPGEVVGFLGPNGAGKSTTMRILTGVMPATSGEAWVCGEPVARFPERIKRRIGYMPENNPLPEDLRVGEYLRLRAQLKNIPWRQQARQVQRVMDICDLSRKARRKIIGSLSKGFRQRVGIADALLGEPEVIIMDEPTIGLDPHQIQAMRDLIRSLRGRMTVLLSSHILPEIELCTDRIVIINQGHIVATGTAGELRKAFVPETTYEVELSGSVSPLEATVKRVDPDIRVRDTFPVPGLPGRMKVRLTARGPSDHGPSLLRALGKLEGTTVHSLARCEPTLEAVFMAATRRSWDERSDKLHFGKGSSHAPFRTVADPGSGNGDDAEADKDRESKGSGQ